MLYILEKNALRLCVSDEEKTSIIDLIRKNLDTYRFDHYRYYPAKDTDGWKKLFIETLTLNFEKQDHIFVFKLSHDIPILIGYRVTDWDEAIFGYKLATSIVTYVPEQITTPVIAQVMKESLAVLDRAGVKSVVFRCNGDQLPLIHTIGDLGFQYYETIVWPIVNTKQLMPTDADANPIRYIKASEYDKAALIAKQFQYHRGHFYCDDRFDKASVDSLYAKWVVSSEKNGAKVVVIEEDSSTVPTTQLPVTVACPKRSIAGYFVCKLDPSLKKHLGFEYGRLTSLALDGQYRGQGLGGKLFAGTLNVLKTEGAEYIDSGYATKNHLSAKLHVQHCFMPVYEEVTFHYWFGGAS